MFMKGDENLVWKIFPDISIILENLLGNIPIHGKYCTVNQMFIFYHNWERKNNT